MKTVHLGNDNELLEGLQIGTADMWAGGPGVFTNSSQSAQIFTVPFMFESQEHFDKVYDGEIGQEIAELITEESGNRILSYLARGARMLTVDQEVNTPEDLAGLKIRVPESPVFLKNVGKFRCCTDSYGLRRSFYGPAARSY